MPELNAIELLEAHHWEFSELFREIQGARLPEDKQALFDELADRLAVHLSIEEGYLHPAVRAAQGGVSPEESADHLALKQLLLEMMPQGVEGPTFEVQLALLKERVDQHIGVESRETFRTAKAVLGERELVSLAERMVAAQFELEGIAPRAAIVWELHAAG